MGDGNTVTCEGRGTVLDLAVGSALTGWPRLIWGLICRAVWVLIWGALVSRFAA